MGTRPFAVRSQTRASDGQLVLTLSGALTSLSCPQFLEAVQAAGGRLLILDLSEVPYIDSMAIGSLVQAYVSCRKASRQLALAGVNQRVKAMLKITSLEPLFDMYPAVSDVQAWKS